MENIRYWILLVVMILLARNKTAINNNTEQLLQATINGLEINAGKTVYMLMSHQSVTSTFFGCGRVQILWNNNKPRIKL